MSIRAVGTVLALATVAGACGGPSSGGRDASLADAGVDAALADASVYDPGDAARPAPACGIPIRRLTVGGPRFEDAPSVLAGEGDRLLTVMPLVTSTFEPAPLRVRETNLLDWTSREASTTLPEGEWNVVAVADLDGPTALLQTVGELRGILWAELTDGAIDLIAVPVPDGVEYLAGSVGAVSDRAGFLTMVSTDGQVGVMRISRSTAEVVRVDVPGGAARYALVGSTDGSSAFVASSGFELDPRTEIARIDAGGAVIAGWERVLEGEHVIALHPAGGGVIVTAHNADEVIVIRLDGELVEIERLRPSLDRLVGAWTIEASHPALLAMRSDSPASASVLFGRLPALDDLRVLAETRFAAALGWTTSDGGYAVAVPGSTSTDVYLLCDAP